MFSLTVCIYFKDWLLVDSTTGPRRQLLTIFNPSSCIYSTVMLSLDFSSYSSLETK